MAKNQNEVQLPASDGAPNSTTFEKASGELGEETLQKATDEAEAKGYIGTKVDPRPNTDYSQEGGMPTG